MQHLMAGSRLLGSEVAGGYGRTRSVASVSADPGRPKPLAEATVGVLKGRRQEPEGPRRLYR